MHKFPKSTSEFNPTWAMVQNQHSRSSRLGTSQIICAREIKRPQPSWWMTTPLITQKKITVNTQVIFLFCITRNFRFSITIFIIREFRNIFTIILHYEQILWTYIEIPKFNSQSSVGHMWIEFTNPISVLYSWCMHKFTSVLRRYLWTNRVVTPHRRNRKADNLRLCISHIAWSYTKHYLV